MLAVGLSAQQTQPQTTQPQDPYKSSTSSEDRKVTVQGCLERDYLYSPSTTGATGTTGQTGQTAMGNNPTPFKLTQIDIVKDEKAEKDTGMTGAVKDATTATGSAVATGATKTADAVTGKQSEQKDKDNIELHVATASTANVDLDSQVNHKVELVGIMSNNDLKSARGKSGDKSDTMTKTPLMFKATSVKSIADKCQ
jgi:hypothetical protein